MRGLLIAASLLAVVACDRGPSPMPCPGECPDVLSSRSAICIDAVGERTRARWAEQDACRGYDHDTRGRADENTRRNDEQDARLTELERRVDRLRAELDQLLTDVGALARTVQSIVQDVRELTAEFQQLLADHRDLESRFTRYSSASVVVTGRIDGDDVVFERRVEPAGTPGSWRIGHGSTLVPVSAAGDTAQVSIADAMRGEYVYGIHCLDIEGVVCGSAQVLVQPAAVAFSASLSVDDDDVTLVQQNSLFVGEVEAGWNVSGADYRFWWGAPSCGSLDDDHDGAERDWFFSFSTATVDRTCSLTATVERINDGATVRDRVSVEID